MDDYLCAGIIPFRKRIAKSERNVIDILLGGEWRDRDHAYVWNFFSGRRESFDVGPAETAVREFWEESGRYLSPEWCLNTLEVLKTIEPVYIERAVFYFVPETQLFTTSIVDSFDAHSDKSVMKQISWICYDTIGYSISRHVDIYGYYVSGFIKRIWRHLAKHCPY